ncbi:MAG: hypothetical protein EON95_07150 [Caulobacteraceae bacterium]|nr:MAG: hypothetical protein EON95_07150 [Caulobacteraceae bacterium]
MSEAAHSLKSIFCLDLAQPVGSQPEFSKVLAGMKAAAAVPAASDEGLTRAFNTALEQVMAIQIGDILLASWSRLAALNDAFKSTRADPASVVILPLLDHKVSSSHAPCIDLLCAGKELAKLMFDISVVLQLKGVELEVRHGAINSVTAGKAVGEGKLVLAGKTLVQRKSRELPLPGRLAWGAAPVAAAS